MTTKNIHIWKNRKHPMLGKSNRWGHHSEESKLKNRLAHLGKKNPKASETQKRLYQEGKLIIWNKGLPKELNPLTGRKRPEFIEWIKQHPNSIPKFEKGHIPWNKNKKGYKLNMNISKKGKHYSPDTEWKKGQVIGKEFRFKKGFHNSPSTEFKFGHKEPLETKQKRVKRIFQALNKHPNKKESYINSIIQSNFPNQYKLNIPPNITVINGRIPDWVNVNGQKKIILFNGIYWHLWRLQKKNPNLTKEQVEEFERKPYEDFGFKVLHIWEDELDNKELILNKIKCFIEVV